jgi:uncharacterized protein YecA (UPF0149 family)
VLGGPDFILVQAGTASRIKKGKDMEKPKKGTIIKVLDLSRLPVKVQQMVKDARLPYLTARTRCPCGSGKRFKRCHGAGLDLTK